jgi:hypothetical protein
MIDHETEIDAEVHTLPIDAHVISLDETDHYQIDPEDAPFIAQIRGAYFYDSNVVTHCCELTGSYYLMHIGDSVILTPAGEELTDEQKDDIYQKYEFNGGDDIYVHCHTIDRLAANAGRFEYHHYGETGVSYEDSDYDEQIEGLREHFCGNAYV